jgi:hypothetical protein
VNNKDVLHLYTSSHFTSVNLANDSPVPIAGAGSLSFSTGHGPAELDSVLHCPSASSNLLSISRLDDKGYASIFADGYYVLPNSVILDFIAQHTDQLLLEGYRSDHLYYVDLPVITSSSNPQSLLSKVPRRSLSNWHLSTNHLHSRAMLRMATMVDGMKLSDRKITDCVPCIVGKAHDDPHPRSTRKLSRCGQILSADWIESLPRGLGISLQVIDWYSGKSFVFQLSSKTQIQMTMINLMHYIKTHTGRSVGLLLMDQGSQFTTNELRDYCVSGGTDINFRQLMIRL